MKITGIICEYNPFHLGHAAQIRKIRAQLGEDCAIVCLMSGDYVQRGAPAVFPKAARAKAALLSGADLVLELPVTYALRSAEGFAAGGVQILSGFCDYLSFGSESGDAAGLMETAAALLSSAWEEALRRQLETGISFPAARQAALEELGLDSRLLQKPNDILAVEYCKAILKSGSSLQPLVIRRGGSYHSTEADPENPSATFLRQQLLAGKDWASYVPEAAVAVYQGEPLHSLAAGERAILARLRTMTDAEFEALPFGSEGLWRKLMHTSRSGASVEQIAQAVKSKRYTRTRIDRMILCAYLGITEEMLYRDVPYVRVLACSEKGQKALKLARQSSSYPHVGEKVADPYWTLEQRWCDLYGLFREESPAPAGLAAQQRIVIGKRTGE